MKKRFLASLLTLCLTASLSAAPASALALEDAKELLQAHYVDEIPDSVLELDSLDAILETLGDPYTSYMSPEEYASFLSVVNGTSVVGIGVSIQTVFNNGYQILSILPNSPAQKAGLEAGDRVIEVNGVALNDASDVASMIGGDADTKVTITVIRQSDGSRQTYTLTRRPVAIPIVTYDQVGEAGVIDCTSFGSTTVETVQEALETLDKDVSVWIMDLRSNPGGTSDAAAGSAGLFVGSATMVYFRDANDSYEYLYTLPSCPDLTDKPLLILTSPYSASGSELFAGAARDHGFGIGIGQRTFGKGIAQSVFDETNTEGIFDGDCLKITTYRFYSPNGTTNHIVGVLPTLLISPENTGTVALLLSTPDPGLGHTKNHMELDFHNFSLYVDLTAAMAEENQAAFTELLEALPPFCTIRMGNGHGWVGSSERTAEVVAQELGLPFVSRAGFTDVDMEAASWLETLAVYDLVAGYEDGTFRPDAAITRAEFCTLLANALNLPAKETAPIFSDTPADAWYAGYVSAMTSMGFIAGYEDGTFRPHATISNQEMMAILSSAASWLNMNVYNANDPLTAEEEAEYADFAPWARAAARNLGELNISLFQSHGQPDDPATRRTAAWFLYRVMEETGLIWGLNYPDDLADPQ